MKLTVKLTLVAIATSFVAIIGIIFLVYRFTATSFQATLGEELTELAKNKMHEIDVNIYERTIDVEFLAESDNLREFVLLNQDPQLSAAEPDSLTAELQAHFFHSGAWREFEVINPDNNIILSSNPDERGNSVLSRPETMQAINATSTKHIYHSEAHTDPEWQGLVMIIAAPIKDISQPDHPIIATLISKLHFNIINETLDGIGGVSAYIVNSSGNIIASNYPDHRDESLLDTHDHSQSPAILKLLKRDVDAGVEQSLHSEDQSLFAFAQQSGYLDYPGSEWGLLLESSRQAFLTPSIQSTFQLISYLAPIVLLVIVLALLSVNHSIIRPIVRITAASNLLAEGKFDNPIPVNTKDEIGKLAQTFNTMATQVKSARQSLESQVSSRTQDLKTISGDLEHRQEALLNVLEDAKELESSLVAEKARTELIVSSMGEGLVMVNDRYNVAAANPTAERLIGVTEKELIGKPWAKVVTVLKNNVEIPLQQRAAINVIKNGISVPIKLEDNYYFLTTSGKKYPIVSVTSPIKQDNKVVGAVMVFSDATSEKEAKALIERTVQERTQALAEQQALSTSILEQAGEGIVLTNDAGQVTYLNPAFTKITGYKNENLKGKSYATEIQAFTLKEEPIPPSQRSDAAAVTAEHQEMKMLLESNMGTKVAVISNASPVRVAGEFRGVVRVLHDFSEDLRLNRQKDDFFSIASHELRTPLSVISGNLDTILAGYGQTKFSADDKQLLKDSLTSSERLIKIVEDFLNVSRLDQGRLKFSIQPVDLCKVSEDVVKELQSLAVQNNIALTSSCSLKQTKVMADEGLLREILTNLIGNSLKFTKKGSITITHAIKDNFLIATVTDTGSGINPDMHPFLFQRFQQAMKRTLSREVGGTGLGLYISREFARKMGGDLWLASSTPGKGSVFAFKLPLAE